MNQQIIYRQNPPVSDIYHAFMDGFSDYVVQFNFDEQQFESTFLVRDQNQPSRSIVAYANERPIGVVLSGISYLNDRWTTRCGGLAVSPEFRSQHVGLELMRRFDELAKGRRLLEVIQSNVRALSFYKQLGYEIVREILYFQSAPTESTAMYTKESIGVLFDSYYPEACHQPIWQTDARTTQQLLELISVTEGARKGALVFRENVLIDVFGKDEDARWLLQAAAHIREFRITLTSDRKSLIKAAHTLGFKKDALTQYEMVKLSD